MTKKDYELIATGIKNANLSVEVLEKVVKSVSTQLALDNTRFKGGVFYTACGLKRNIRTHSWEKAN